MTASPYFEGVPATPYAGRVGITYARVSTKGQSAEAQDLRCANYLAAASVPLDRAFSDSFTGGGDFMQRPAMRELLAYIDASPHKSFVVVFDDLKRFARDTEFHLKLRHAFRRRDVLLACLNYNFEDSPEGKFAETVFAAQAELERHQNRRQVIQKMKARLERGYWTFSSKLGYDMTPDEQHGKLAVPNADGQLLAEGLRGFADGRFVRRIDVCRFLVERGLWSRQSPDKYLDRVSAFLLDPFYCGDIEYPSWEVSRRPGRHEPIITRETFDRIQLRLRTLDSGKRIRADVSEDFPLRRLLVCAGCGGHLTASHSKGRTKRYSYYLCRTQDCTEYAVSLRKEEVEDGFAGLLMRNRLKPEADGLLATMFERAWNAERQQFAKSAENQTHAVHDLKEKIRDFAHLAREATSPSVRRSYEEQIEATASELEALEENAAVAADLSIPYRTALEKATGLLKNPISIWDSVDVVEKQRLFFFLFEAKLEYGRNEGYRTGEKLSATRLFEEFFLANSDYVQSEGNTSNGQGNCSPSERAALGADHFDSLKKYLTRFWRHYQDSPTLRAAMVRSNS